MNRRLLFSAVLLLVLASLMVFRSQIEGDLREEGDPHEAIRNSSDVDGGIIESDSKRLSSRKLSKETIEKIKSLGYQFSADKINKRSAVGHVTLVTPEGAVLKSNFMSISSDGDYIYLAGEILVEMKSEGKTMRLRYSGESASAKIGLDGKLLSFEGDAAMVAITSEPYQ